MSLSPWGEHTAPSPGFCCPSHYSPIFEMFEEAFELYIDNLRKSHKIKMDEEAKL